MGEERGSQWHQPLPQAHSPHLLHIPWAAQAAFGKLQPWLLVPSKQQLWPRSVVANHRVCVSHAGRPDREAAVLVSSGAALGPTATAWLFAAESVRESVHRDF